MAKKTIAVRLDEKLIERLKKTAKKFGTDQTAIVEHAIDRELNRIETEKKPLFE